MKNELETILKAFGEHIEGQNYFDIVYSPKAGYPRSDSPRMTAFEEAESRRITACLEKTEGDSTDYLNDLDSFMEEYQERYNGDGE